MAFSKRIGFFCGEEKMTLVEFGKNASFQVFSSPMALKSAASSPFGSNLTEEIQITAVLQKMLRDNRMTGGSFYISLPMKETILRSFVIPFVKQEDIANVIKFEAKKYLPIDIEELTFVFYTAPFTENKIKRLQIILFAVRKEALARYERIFKQADAVVSYGEPCMVSLIKALLFKKEINPADRLAFLVLGKNAGHICFIDRGIPQFVREFSLNLPLASPEAGPETREFMQSLNLKVVNEVDNSFDFYARQFGGEPIKEVLFSAQDLGQELWDALEGELKLKLRKLPPIVTRMGESPADDMDAIYAMGACVEPPMASLSGFNFFADKTQRSKLNADFLDILRPYKESIFIFLICVIFLLGVHVLFQAQLKVAQEQYHQLFSRQGVFLNTPVVTIQADIQQNTDKLAAYKKIRTKSDMVPILLRVASLLPQGAALKELKINYDPDNPNDAHAAIDMDGDVFKKDPSEQIAVVERIFSDFKNDKELGRFIKSVNLISLHREDLNGRQATEFKIHCF